jgi:hypothetical protein
MIADPENIGLIRTLSGFRLSAAGEGRAETAKATTPQSAALGVSFDGAKRKEMEEALYAIQ